MDVETKDWVRLASQHSSSGRNSTYMVQLQHTTFQPLTNDIPMGMKQCVCAHVCMGGEEKDLWLGV